MVSNKPSTLRNVESASGFYWEALGVGLILFSMSRSAIWPTVSRLEYEGLRKRGLSLERSPLARKKVWL